MRLHINIDHVATLRNQRDTIYPDPVVAARLCMEAGADGITVHLREDRRHIRDVDVRRLAQERPSGLRLLNLEMAATNEMGRLAAEVRPEVVTLVPEKRQERTTEGGLDVIAARDRVQPIAHICEQLGIKLSLFIEPNIEQLRASLELGARQVEFHTGHYCDATGDEAARLLSSLAEAAKYAAGLGLEVAAGHGLNCHNVAPIAAIPQIEELNIGHSVVSEAVLVGMKPAVLNLRQAITSARNSPSFHQAAVGAPAAD